LSYDNPNFTIITSGGCNSFCSFCTDPFKRKASPDYLANLATTLQSRLPGHFRQVSISGGEPTLSPDLPAILRMVQASNRFDKVVLTTNGARLSQHIGILKETVDHLNVSRHAIGYEANTKVFGTRAIIGDIELKAAAFELNKAGIDINLNHVYAPDSALTVQYVLDYLDYARSVGATSVSFRYDQNENSLEPTYLEKLFSEWAVIHAGGCPVCRNHTVLVGGFPVVFKASFAEPSKAINDVYELVYHITGKLTTDWEGTREFTPATSARYVAEFEANPHKAHVVVTHTVAAPNNSKRGVKSVPLAPVTVVPQAHAVYGPATRKQPASPVSTPVPVASKAVAPSGGGCGGLSGGGCGSSVSSSPRANVSAGGAPGTSSSGSPTVPVRSTTTSTGGGCGGSLGGGGCGM
jgi:organic radical activating enzyme